MNGNVKGELGDEVREIESGPILTYSFGKLGHVRGTDKVWDKGVTRCKALKIRGMLESCFP